MMLSLQETGFLLAALCRELGLCLSPEERRALLDQSLPDAESFTEAVFAAEGVGRARSDHALHQRALATVERVFADHARADP
jgi:hypothetical protein